MTHQVPPRPIFETELARLVEQIKHQLPSCVNCRHGVNMQVTDGVDVARWPSCALDPERRTPPPRVIAFGCPAFAGDIPF